MYGPDGKKRSLNLNGVALDLEMSSEVRFVVLRSLLRLSVSNFTMHLTTFEKSISGNCLKSGGQPCHSPLLPNLYKNMHLRFNGNVILT